VRVEAQARHVDGALASQREQRRLAPTELRHEPWPDADQTTYAQGEGLLPRAQDLALLALHDMPSCPYLLPSAP
jgi:hypothetical protein